MTVLPKKRKLRLSLILDYTCGPDKAILKKTPRQLRGGKKNRIIQYDTASYQILIRKANPAVIIPARILEINPLSNKNIAKTGLSLIARE